MDTLRSIWQAVLACFSNPFPYRRTETFPAFREPLHSMWRNENGETAILAAVGMSVIVGFVGLAIDVGRVRSTKRNLQMAADAAAMAGALEVQACNGQTNCGTMQGAVLSSLAENGLTGVTLMTQCAQGSGSGITVTLNNGPCLAGGADPNSGKSSYVEVMVSQTLPMTFGKVVGYGNMALSARAEAARTGNRNCVYALDPSGGNAMTVDLLATVNANCGFVDESSAWNAFSCNLLAYVSVPHIVVNGGVEGFLCGANPVPTTNVAPPNPADPLAYLPKPAVPACGGSTGSPYHGSASPLVILGAATLYPDAAYCGGIVLLPTANVTFMPGTYVIKSGGLLGLQGGLGINLLSTAVGTGVTFYNYGPNGGVTFIAPSLTLGNVSLTAPTSGTYAGMLFMQDPGNTTPATLVASSTLNTKLEGAFYFPTASVNYLVSGPSKYNILVAKDIDFSILTFGGAPLQSVFGNDFSDLPAGSPLQGGGAVLVQ